MRALLLAWRFPPQGGAGTQRTLGLVRRLPALGIACTVLTAPRAAAGERWGPHDADLDARVPPDVDVLRLSGALPAPGSTRVDRLLGRAGARERRWAEALGTVAVPAAGRVDVVVASLAPYSTAEAAARLASELGVPWVADLRDPWALDEVRSHPTAAHRTLDRRRMRQALRSAAAIVLTCEEARRVLVATWPELAACRPTVVPNGFDAEELGREGRVPPATGSALRVVHAGTSHDAATRVGPPWLRRLLGGGSRADLAPRSTVHLLAAAEAARRAGAEVEVHLAGSGAPASGAGRAVGHGYLPHGATLELLRSADVVFLPLHDLRLGDRARIVPGKAYEALATGRPVLAAVPAGDLRDLLATCPTATTCAPGDVAGLTAALVAAHDRRRLLGPEPDRVPEAIRAYDRDVQAVAFAALLEEVTAARVVRRPQPAGA